MLLKIFPQAYLHDCLHSSFAITAPCQCLHMTVLEYHTNGLDSTAMRLLGNGQRSTPSGNTQRPVVALISAEETTEALSAVQKLVTRIVSVLITSLLIVLEPLHPAD